MLRTIIYREFLSNIITFRFLMGLLVCVGWVGANIFVLVKDYGEQIQELHPNVREYTEAIRHTPAYSYLGAKYRLMTWKTPSVLTILNESVLPQVGSSAQVSYNRVPVFTGGSKEYGNPYLVMFPGTDLTLVFQIVVSLLAFLFAYDTVAGEREDGTLALTLSNSVSRGTLLLGKYLGGMLSLCVPIVVSLLVAFQIILFAPYVQVSGTEWVRLGLFGVVSLIYVGVSFTLGMLFSTLTRRAATALMLTMFFWVVFVVVWPQASVFAVSQLVPLDQWVDKRGDFDREMKRQARAYGEQLGIPMKPYGVPEQYLSDPDQYYPSLGGTCVGTYDGPPGKLSAFHEVWKYREELIIRLADELGDLQREYLMQQPVRQAELAQKVSRISPTGAYASTTAILASTDLGNHLQFLDRARQYRAELIQYLRDQNAFGSAKWYSTEAMTDADREGIPIWRDHPEPLASSLRRATPDILILITLNALFFLLSFAAFLRCDAR